MSGCTEKLQDQRFRRTAACSKYLKLLREKSAAIPSYDDTPVEGKTLNAEYIRCNGVDRPLLIKNGKKDMHMRMPDPSVSLSEISNMLGAGTPIKVIDVGNQEELDNWTFGDYASFFENRSKDHKILNLISLEISASPLATKIQGPSFVRQIDWIDAFWPSARRARGDFPRVQKYLLAGMQGAYTDFHLDFGGTSVWYHILWGEKVFYFIRPTGANLLVFEKWSKDSLQSNQFLPDLLPPGECFKIHLRQGDTMIIPGGWIHAVYTPLDSLVFGGNFIHTSSIVKQLQVYGVEERTRVGKKYRFPYFKQLMWLALTSLLPIARPDADTGRSDSRELFANDPFYDLFLGLDEPRTMQQWIYLVKMCDLWLKNGDLSADDQPVFAQAASQAGCANNDDVITAWFSIFRSRIENSTDKAMDEFKDTLDRIGVVTMSTKDFLLSLCKDPSLDSDCAMPSIRVCSQDILADSLLCSLSASEHRSPDAVKSEEVNTGTPDQSGAAPSAPRGSGIRLKFKLSAAASEKTESVVKEEKPSAEPTSLNEGDAVTSSGENRKANLAIEVPADSSASLFGSDDEEEQEQQDEEGKTTGQSTEGNGDAAEPKKTFKFRLKSSSETNNADSNGDSAPAAEVKTNLAFKVKKIRKVKATEVIKEDTLGKERYGTRGLKLSAKFLENAADYMDDESEEEESYAIEEPMAAASDSAVAVVTTAASGAVLVTESVAVEQGVVDVASSGGSNAPVIEAAPKPKVGGQKRRRANDEDFVFDVNDAADEEYHVSDEDQGNEDDEWMAEADDGDEDYVEESDEESRRKKRKTSTGAVKSAPRASAAPAPAAAVAATAAGGGMRIKIGSSAAMAQVAGVGTKPVNKLKPFGIAAAPKGGNTIRQQLMKKLGNKYK